MKMSFPSKIIFFYSDATDARIKKRFSQVNSAGLNFCGVGFWRLRYGSKSKLSFANFDLGEVHDGSFFLRFKKFFLSYFKIINFYRSNMENFGILYAINLDMLLMALLVRPFLPGRQKILYETADIHPLLTRKGILSMMFRLLERMCVRSVDVIITTSQGFIENYFDGINKLSCRFFVLENKIFDADCEIQRDVKAQKKIDKRRITVGLFGAFRCDKTIELLGLLLERRKNFVVNLHGVPSNVDINKFDNLIAHPRCHYFGEYSYPQDLRKIYSEVDIVMATDFSCMNGNSSWLLPNRYYEAGLFSKPMIVSAETYLAELVESNGVGKGIFPEVDSLLVKVGALLLDIESGNIDKVYQIMPDSKFLDQGEIENLFSMLDISIAQSEA